MDSILQKSIEHSQMSQKLTQLVEQANHTLSVKDYTKAIEIIRAVIKMATEMGSHDLAAKYTKNLDDVIRILNS